MVKQLIQKHNLKINSWDVFGANSIQHNFKLPKDKLDSLTKEESLNLINGLYLFSLELSKNWSQGLNILKEFGFKEINNTNCKPNMKFKYLKQINQNISFKTI